MKTKATKATNWYALVYCGAPYADGELGHAISWHKSREAAEAAWRQAQNDPRTYGSNSRVVCCNRRQLSHDALVSE